MLPQLMSLLPDRVVGCSLGAATMAAVAGFALWLLGARFSRSLTTLIAVAIGTLVGMRLPAWFGWNMSGMAVGVGGAVALGASGYLMHRSWVGVYLAFTLGLWTSITAWLLFGNDRSLPRLWFGWDAESMKAMIYFWNQLSASLAHLLAGAALAGLAAGIILVILWPRLSRALTWSLIGTTLSLTAFLVIAASSHPGWMIAASITSSLQAAILLGLVGVGTLIQWRLAPTPIDAARLDDDQQ